MNILYVIHYPVFGGPHNQALRLTAPLAERGIDTTVVLPLDARSAAERLRQGGVDVTELDLHRLRARTDPRLLAAFATGVVPEIQQLRRLIRDRCIDVVQVGGLVNPHAAIAARLEHIPVVWQLLDTRAPRLVAVAAMALVDEMADAVMSTGRSVAMAHPLSDRIADRLVPFFPPVDTAIFRPRPDEREEVRRSWGVPRGSPVVGCVANMNPQKGVVDLVAAFATLRAAEADARLVLVGAEYPTHAGYSALVRARAGAAGLVEGRDIIFAGARDDVHTQLAGFDVLGFSPVPRGEGVSTVVLEAMASGLPVVTTAVAGLPEAIEDGVTGRLVPPGEPEAFSRALLALVRDSMLRRRLGDAARRYALDHFGIERCVNDHIAAYDLALARHGRVRRSIRVPSERPTPVSIDSREPPFHGQATCSRTSPGATPPTVDDVRLLVADPSSMDHDEIDHAYRRSASRAAAQKGRQAAHFDRGVAEEFEIVRPHGAPRLYGFLLQEKFRRATSGIGPDLAGLTVLTVCGGSGMDAEYLARAGARVVATDISRGAIRRLRERSRRFGLDITGIVADVEHLPFADRAFDLVLVHDGLHHLQNPSIGLAEMARVSRKWVSVTEPARAAVTALAVRAGVALEREDAGNVVVRLTPDEVVSGLRRQGFRPVTAERYAMYYRHEPGTVSRLLSRPFVFPVVRLAWRGLNRVVGRFGNKMTVLAVRDALPGTLESPVG